jgi:hypothetical protein
MLPFTRGQFFALFVVYNEAVWPAQIVALVLGLAMLAAVVRPSPQRSRFVTAGLALMWLWTGVAYHWAFFTAINRAAWAFGALFVLQAALLAVAAARGRLDFGWRAGVSGPLGAALVAYAIVVYPLVGLLAGHAYPGMPMFGIAPCPVVIFTFGLLLLTRSPLPRALVVMPLLWALIGGSAAFMLGVPQDWALLASAVVAPILWLRDRRARTSVVHEAPRRAAAH